MVFKFIHYICNHVAKYKTADHVQLRYPGGMQFFTVSATLPGLPIISLSGISFESFIWRTLAWNGLSLCTIGVNSGLGIRPKDCLPGVKIRILADYIGFLPQCFTS